jgi:GNAT superfamily N-acetyltransferase
VATLLSAMAKLYYPAKLEGFIASIEGQRIGLATYYVHNDDSLELITIDALVQGKGIGSKLLLAVEEKAKTLNCKQIIVVTTNDNIDALAFYQKRGYLISTISYDAIAEARKIKPTIPLIGNHGININCQIELTKTINVDRQKNSEFFCGP